MPATPPARASRPSASTATWCPYAVEALGAAHGDPDTGGISVAAVATAFPSGRASRSIKLADTADAVARRSGRDRHGHRPRRVPLRSLRTRLRRDRRGQGGVQPRRRQLRPPQGDPRDRRAQHLRQRAPRILAGDPRRRRLHQDLHRQGGPGRDPPGHPAHARGRARLVPPHGREGRRQAGRRHPLVQGRDQVPGDRRRDRRRGVAARRTCSASAPPAC